MKKFLTFLLLNLIALLLAGIYGIIHDQLTYTISEEYYTKFKFIQFGLIDEGSVGAIAHPRLNAALVGILATWWMGIPIGVILGAAGFAQKNQRQMFKVTLKSFVITLIVAFITGLAGLIYGKFYLANTGVDWRLPEDLLDKANYLAVGSMHNFSYLGGFIGLLLAISYSFWKGRKPGKEHSWSFGRKNE